jgi:DNA (cytosine-5)-methyltransferase 1
MTITFGSLFAGIGGFDLGFERAGMVCKWQVEIDDYANKVLSKHWPGVHRERDIRECGKHNLERVDVICGGFPCQDISYAGLGAGLEGERSGLFFEAVRVVRQLRPSVVVLENVAALLTRGLDRVLGTLATIGYDAEWHCIPAAAVGAPHRRDRVFIILHVANTECSQRRPKPKTRKDRPHRNDSRREKTTGGPANGCQDVADTQSNRLEGLRPSEQQISDPRSQKNEPQGICDPRLAGHWATEPDVGRLAHGIPSRVDRLRGLGNAVVPQVAEYIARYVIDQHF